jgi:hypothetical protein
MLLATFCAIPVFLMLNILLVLAKLLIDHDYHIRILRELSISLAAFALAFISLVIWIGGYGLEHIDSQRLENKVYNLAAIHEYDDMGFVPLVLYECSSEGLFCKRIYESESGYFIDYQQVLLISNVNANTLSVIVDGETLYTCSPN